MYFLLHLVIQHNLYHAGQIALLKKGRWLARQRVIRFIDPTLVS